MSEEREEVYQILELGKHEKNLHHKKGFGGLLFIDLSMIKFSKLSSYIKQLDKENQELKKQLEEKENIACDWKDSCLENAGKIEILEIQQKEFIKYLEDEIKQINPKILDDGELNLRLDDIKYTQYLTYKEILQKYKSIIGGNDV